MDVKNLTRESFHIEHRSGVCDVLWFSMSLSRTAARGKRRNWRDRKREKRREMAMKAADSTLYNYLTHYLRNAFDIEATELFQSAQSNVSCRWSNIDSNKSHKSSENFWRVQSKNNLKFGQFFLLGEFVFSSICVYKLLCWKRTV